MTIDDQSHDYSTLISEFEKDFDVENWKHSHIHLWPIIRIALTTEWLNSVGGGRGANSPQNRAKMLSAIYARLKAMASSLPSILSLFVLGFKPNRLAQGSVGIFTNDVSREEAGDSCYQRFFDTFIDLQVIDATKAINFEHISHGRYPPYRPRINITGAEFLAMWLGWALNKFGFLNLSSHVPFSEIFHWCALRGLPCYSASSERTSRRYASLIVLSKLYLWIIRAFKLTSAIKVCWYGIDGMALALACRRAEIPCIDLQHGVAGAGHHRAYSNWTKFPLIGYALMPTSFWCWSRLDEQSLRTCFDAHGVVVETRVIGNLWAKLAKKRGHSLWYKNLFCLNGKVKNWANNGSKIILVTLQGENLPVMIRDALKLSPANWHWAIRVHPMFASNLRVLESLEEATQRYSFVDVKCSSASSLYPLLSAVTVHVTEWSAVYYDADLFGVKTVFVSPKSLQIFGEVIDSGAALYADTPGKLIAALHKIVRNCNPTNVENIPLLPAIDIAD